MREITGRGLLPLNVLHRTDRADGLAQIAEVLHEFLTTNRVDLIERCRLKVAKRVAPKVTDAELTILELLWDRATASTRQIVDALYPGGGAGRYATVQKQLERMEAKGLIHRDRSYFQHLFSAAVDREELAGQRLRTVLDKLCEGSLTPLLMNLVRAKPLSDNELQELRDLVKELSKQQRRKGEAR